MKKIIIFVLGFVLGITGFWPGHAGAGDNFFDSITYGISGSGTDKAISARLYGALATSAWLDTNLNGRLDQSETIVSPIRIYNRHGNLAVVSPNGLNKDQIQNWAIQNSKAIWEAIFPSGLSESTGQTEDGIMAPQSLSGKMQKAKPSKKKADAQGVFINNEFKGALEYLNLDVNDDSGDAFSILIDYVHSFGDRFQLSVNLPYRYTTLDDQINSKSHFLGLDLSGKFLINSWDGLDWEAGMDLFGSAFYLKSDAISHAGNLKYGAGIFTTITRKFSFATLSVGTDFRISDAKAPSSWIDSDSNTFVDELVDYVNDLEAVKTLSYGFNLGVPLMNDTAAINLEVIRSNFFSDDIDNDRDSQTTVGLSFSYFPTPTFELSLGVRQTFELDNIDLFGVFLGAVYRY